MAETQAKIDAQSLAYQGMVEGWELLDNLLGGTVRMREAGTEWLPRSEGESYGDWEARRDRSFLFGAYKDTLSKIAGKPFSKPVSLRGELPNQLEPIAADVDRAGRNLTQFGRDILHEGVHRGLTHVLVDFPAGQSADNRQEVLGLRRPYFVHVPAVDLFAWRGERDITTGERRLTHIRYKTTDVEPVGEWGEKKVDIIRVWNAPPRDEGGAVTGPGTWEKWRKALGERDGQWHQIERGKHSFPGVPLLTFYTNRTGFLVAEPPLRDLGWQNLRHWQSSSEQNNILHVARVPILFRKGWPTHDAEGRPVSVSIHDSATTSSTEAAMEWVEPKSGKALESGASDLERIEERMEILGAQPFMRRTGTMVATGRAIDNAEANSMVKSLVAAEELFIKELYELAAQWLNVVKADNVRLPADFGVDIFSEFGLSLRATQDIEALIKARIAREISRETFLRELKARALLSESIEVEEEMERIEAEGPPLGTMTFGDDDDEAPDVDERQDDKDADDAEEAAA
jgi:hypothetical protein